MDEIINLIISAKKGNGDSFEKLCEKYSGLIVSMSGKYSNMCSLYSEESEDFLQEAKMAFYNAVMAYDIENKNVMFGAYAKVCIRNRLISCIRSITSKKRQKSELKTKYDGDSLQDVVLQRELEKKIMKLAENSLSSYEKKIFLLYAEGQRAKEISASIGKSEKSVNNAVYRIKAKLKRTINNDT